ncbi:MAG: hypothetical protein ACOY99_10885 [Pseudomonadota bacterium]
MNLYAYAGNDPINATDPMGLCHLECLEDGAGGSPGTPNPIDNIIVNPRGGAIGPVYTGYDALSLFNSGGGKRFSGVSGDNRPPKAKKQNNCPYNGGCLTVTPGGQGNWWMAQWWTTPVTRDITGTLAYAKVGGCVAADICGMNGTVTSTPLEDLQAMGITAGLVAGPIALDSLPPVVLDFLGPKGPVFGNTFYRGYRNSGFFNFRWIRIGWSYNAKTGLLEFTARIGDYHLPTFIKILPPAGG